jgi:hypothetical protein
MLRLLISALLAYASYITYHCPCDKLLRCKGDFWEGHTHLDEFVLCVGTAGVGAVFAGV